MASSMSYPVYEITAITAFVPLAYSSIACSSYDAFRTMGDCGVCSLYVFVSTRWVCAWSAHRVAWEAASEGEGVHSFYTPRAFIGISRLSIVALSSSMTKAMSFEPTLKRRLIMKVLKVFVRILTNKLLN